MNFDLDDEEATTDLDEDSVMREQPKNPTEQGAQRYALEVYTALYYLYFMSEVGQQLNMDAPEPIDKDECSLEEVSGGIGFTAKEVS